MKEKKKSIEEQKDDYFTMEELKEEVEKNKEMYDELAKK